MSNDRNTIAASRKALKLWATLVYSPTQRIELTLARISTPSEAAEMWIELLFFCHAKSPQISAEGQGLRASDAWADEFQRFGWPGVRFTKAVVESIGHATQVELHEEYWHSVKCVSLRWRGRTQPKLGAEWLDARAERKLSLSATTETRTFRSQLLARWRRSFLTGEMCLTTTSTNQYWTKMMIKLSNYCLISIEYLVIDWCIGDFTTHGVAINLEAFYDHKHEPSLLVMLFRIVHSTKN